jgi:hypothetical protein
VSKAGLVFDASVDQPAEKTAKLAARQRRDHSSRNCLMQLIRTQKSLCQSRD